MTETQSEDVPTRGLLLSKVPEVTVWFWIIKILCTTLGESFADWIDTTLGFGLNVTAMIFTVALVSVLGWQLRLDRYIPFVYWLTVVVVSVTGTLYTDVLTDKLGVALALSTTLFAAALAVVFGVWSARERTLSIHSIVTLPRESFYWIAVLVTFALGTAAGDWTLELTGWGPGTSVLLPAGLIAAIVIGWRLGANPVLSFWLAYILTRPLGANLGDWLASPPTHDGLGLGSAATSAIFLTAILGTVVYLTLSRRDVIDESGEVRGLAIGASPARERVLLGYYMVVAVATGAVLVWAASQPHTARGNDEEETGSAAAATLPAPVQVSTHFPAEEMEKFRTIASDTLTNVQARDQAAAKARITDLETLWDDDEPTLRPRDGVSWRDLDGRIDVVLGAIRSGEPDPATETKALTELLGALR